MKPWKTPRWISRQIRSRARAAEVSIDRTCLSGCASGGGPTGACGVVLADELHQHGVATPLHEAGTIAQATFSGWPKVSSSMSLGSSAPAARSRPAASSASRSPDVEECQRVGHLTAAASGVPAASRRPGEERRALAPSRVAGPGVSPLTPFCPQLVGHQEPACLPPPGTATCVVLSGRGQ